MAQNGTEALRGQARRLVGEAGRMARMLGRDDLQRPLRSCEMRLDDLVADTFVIGEYQKGKSALVNALLGGTVVPSGAMLSTAVPLRVTHDSEAGLAEAVVPADGGEPVWRDVSPEDLVRFATTRVDGAGQRRVVIDVFIDHPFLARGITLVDCPPLGRGVSPVVPDVLLGADALVFVTDASQELTLSELRFLESARELCGHVVVALNKVDLHLAWERILELDRRHLETAGIAAPLLPVSAALYQQALVRGDRPLATRSGIPALRDAVVSAAVDQLEISALRGAAETVEATAAALRSPIRVELDALSAQPERREELPPAVPPVAWERELGRLLNELRDELVADLDRGVVRLETEGQAALKVEDPSRVWAELVDWLELHAGEELAGRVTKLAGQLDRGAADLAGRLGVRPPPEDALGHNRSVAQPRFGARESPDGTSGARTAVVGGALMGSSGVYTVLGLLNLANPLLLAALPVMGATAFAVDRYRDVRRTRRAQLERSYAAEVTRFVRSVDKDARTAGLRLLGRARDVYGDHFRNEVATRDRTYASSRAAEARRSDESSEQRSQRRQRLERALSSVDQLDRRAGELRVAAGIAPRVRSAEVVATG